MQKKILAICAALVVFGLVPANASAFKQLVEGAGNPVKAGSEITATNVGNTVLTSSAGPVECAVSKMHGTVTKNEAGAIEGDISTATFEGATAGSKCTGSFGATGVKVTSLPWCVKQSKTTGTYELRGGTCSEAAKPLTFTLETSFFGNCNYERTTPVTGKMTNNSVGGVTSAHLNAEKVVFTRTSGFCPAAGELDMTYKLETSNGTALQWEL